MVKQVDYIELITHFFFAGVRVKFCKASEVFLEMRVSFNIFYSKYFVIFKLLKHNIDQFMCVTSL